VEAIQVASGGSTITHGGGLADRYAAALYSLAEDQHVLDQVVDQIQSLGRLIDESPDLKRLLESPLLDIRQATAAIRAVLQEQGFAEIVVKFASVIAANRRLNKLRAVVTAFGALVAEKRGIVTAHVMTAHRLTDLQRTTLQARLIEAGYGQINIEEQVDPSLLGGLVVRIGARLFDSSIKSRLQRLQYAMKGAA
jgi:F-type H+-transporting ATPase subunit delta